ncbi:MAG: prohibitin family protein [Leptolyngbyaceae bacterium]|nr:prohibitin family protein [Leptolyngbyaceae bacterium]
MKNSQPPSSLPVIIGAIAAALVFIGLNAFVIIYPGQAGVLSILGSAQDGALLEGLHFKPPLIAKVDVYDVTVQKFEIPAQSSTRDLQDLTARFAINFRIDPNRVVEIRRTQGTLQNLVSKVIAPQTQESFKIAAAKRTAEQAITERAELKRDFDTALDTRLEKYAVSVLDTSVIDLNFSTEFARAVEEKQIAEQRAQRAVYVAQEAEQEAQADINRAQGKAESQRLLADTLKAEGGDLVLQKEAIAAWESGGSQMPRVLVMGDDESSGIPFLLNLSDLQKQAALR